MKKHFFPVMLACFVIEFGGFITLALQGREPVKALTLAGLMLIPIFYIIKRMKNPKFNPLKNL